MAFRRRVQMPHQSIILVSGQSGLHSEITATQILVLLQGKQQGMADLLLGEAFLYSMGRTDNTHPLVARQLDHADQGVFEAESGAWMGSWAASGWLSRRRHAVM